LNHCSKIIWSNAWLNWIEQNRKKLSTSTKLPCGKILNA